MNFLKTFEVESHKVDMIPVFFHSRGYRLEGKMPEAYTFRRGGRWANLYSLDARKWATRVEVSLKDLGKDRVRVNVSCHIETRAIATSFHRNKIMTEIEALEKFVASRNNRGLSARG